MRVVEARDAEGLTRADAGGLTAFGRSAGVAYVVRGEATVTGPDVWLAAEVVDIADGRSLGAVERRGPSRDLFRLQRAVAEGAGDDLAMGAAVAEATTAEGDAGAGGAMTAVVTVDDPAAVLGDGGSATETRETPEVVLFLRPEPTGPQRGRDLPRYSGPQLLRTYPGPAVPWVSPGPQHETPEDRTLPVKPSGIGTQGNLPRVGGGVPPFSRTNRIGLEVRPHSGWSLDRPSGGARHGGIHGAAGRGKAPGSDGG